MGCSFLFPAPLEPQSAVPFVTLLCTLHSPSTSGYRYASQIPMRNRGGSYEKETTQCRITARDSGVN